VPSVVGDDERNIFEKSNDMNEPRLGSNSGYCTEKGRYARLARVL